jgi:hypothetical protein
MFCLILVFPLLILLNNQIFAAPQRGLRVVDSKGRQIGEYQASHALLIGVSRYTNGWPQLESIPAEMTQIVEPVESHGFKITRINNPAADELEKSFKRFIRSYGYRQETRLLFFFSGHGFSRSRDGMGYLVPADAPDPRKDPGGFYQKALSMSQILT